MTFRMASIPTPQSKEYLAFVEDEQRKTDEAVRRATVVPTALAREVKLADLDFASIWNLPVPTLQKAFDNPAKRASLFWNVQMRLEGSPRTQQRSDEAQAEFARFVDSLPARTGFRLGVGGVKRFELFVCSQLSAGIETTQDTLSLAFNKLVQCECFSDKELAFDESLKAAPQPEAEPTVTDAVFEQLNLSSDGEESRMGKRIAQDLFDQAFRPVVVRWGQSLMSRFLYDITNAELQAVGNWMTKFNKPRTFESLEQCRVAFIKAGMFPPSCLTHENLKSACIEALPSDDRESLRIVMHGTLDSLKALMQRKGISAV